MKLVVKKSAVIDLIKAKSGEGSRGGKVIGHTKRGKPIYEDRKNEQAINHHVAQAELHHNSYEKHHNEGNKELSKKHKEIRNMHERQAIFHQRKLSRDSTYYGNNAQMIRNDARNPFSVWLGKRKKKFAKEPTYTPHKHDRPDSPHGAADEYNKKSRTKKKD